MTSGFFITGTDTDVGKTWTTVALMRQFQRHGFKVSGMKPVAAGCDWQDGIWQNSDALKLQENASVRLPYQHVNPYAFEQAVSPHLACGGVEVSVEYIVETFRRMSGEVDLVLVEGAGGWYSPLDGALDNAGLARALSLPVVLVVGIRLGCINHARLTERAITASGLTCAGWIGVQLIENMCGFDGNVSFLRRVLDAPFLGVLPYMPEADFDVLSTVLSLPNWQNIDPDQKA